MVLLSAGLVLGVVGCAEPTPSASELEEALVDTGMNPEVADCAAKALTGSLSDEDLSDLTIRGGGAAPVDDPERDDDAYDQLRVAMDRCRSLQAEVAPTTVVPSTEVVPTTTPAGSVTTDGAELNPVPDDDGTVTTTTADAGA